MKFFCSSTDFDLVFRRGDKTEIYSNNLQQKCREISITYLPYAAAAISAWSVLNSEVKWKEIAG
jgi:hypothetical protein